LAKFGDLDRERFCDRRFFLEIEEEEKLLASMIRESGNDIVYKIQTLLLKM
jgi:hypothetical protein